MSASASATLARLVPGRTAFFLCDIQERFRPMIYRFPDVVNTADKMAQASKVLSIPLVVTEQHPKGLGATVHELDVSHAEVHVPKTLFSMHVPEVQRFLLDKKISNVVLFGIESHVCVTQTALDLLENKDNPVDVYILADGVSSMNQAEIPIALKRLTNAGAIVTSSDSVLFALLKDAKHANFKEVSNLVKTFAQKTQDNELFKFVASKL
ncbi:Isochorismatase-like protein [Catenaria anguillulae PL171]|uniref:Isochorismatase-like protein n=1 Tax=Catenaria anguillulae PL171 TaxID=765915 RepID=A0A1Y2I0B7_9FUNG|nr:Isochorismatase-like protein [Catenaria anguillulae PL171]